MVEPILEKTNPYTTGRRRKVSLREVFNAIFYLNKTGGPWRYWPQCFPSYSLVSDDYHPWLENRTLEPIPTEIRQPLRKESGRNENPSAGIMDTRTVKGTQESGEESGFDGGKSIKGRQRHIVVDTIGYLIVVLVHAANVYEGHAAREVLTALFLMMDTIKKIWADGTYKGEEFIQWVKEKFDGVLEVVKKKNTGKGFEVLPRRWVVERTFAWLGRSRRLSKDYKRKTTSSAGQVYIVSSRFMLRRLCKEQAVGGVILEVA